MLQSERIRVIGLILVLSFLLIVIAIRALFGGLPEQLHLLPRFTALILASAAYEGLMLRLVGRAIRRRSDLPPWVWSVNTGIEALIPTATLVLLTESPFMGPYLALGAPATHGYYIFIILSTLHFGRASASGPAWPRRSASAPWRPTRSSSTRPARVPGAGSIRSRCMPRPASSS